MILFKVKSLKKQYKIELYLQCRTNRKSHMVYRMELFSVTLNDPYPGFRVTPFFHAEYLRNGTRYRQFQWNAKKDLPTAYNDTKHCVVSLRQLSFLCTGGC